MGQRGDVRPDQDDVAFIDHNDGLFLVVFSGAVFTVVQCGDRGNATGLCRNQYYRAVSAADEPHRWDVLRYDQPAREEPEDQRGQRVEPGRSVHLRTDGEQHLQPTAPAAPAPSGVRWHGLGEGAGVWRIDRTAGEDAQVLVRWQREGQGRLAPR
uniref:(northern house mosquito) hypothetical protein n=1 Tax=Culex pipiens TaxID=7175 RepID=A0A8D8C8X2_CULPI